MCVACRAVTSAMFVEAAEAAEAVRRQAAATAQLSEAVERLRATSIRSVATCARGSSDHAATYAKYLIETRLGWSVSSASPSIASLYGKAPADESTLALAISQSGGSPDLIAVLTAMRRAGAVSLSLVNEPGSALERASAMSLALLAGPERSVAATKSCIASFALIARLVATLGRDTALLEALQELPTLLDRAWAADWSPLTDGLVDARNLFVIGRGYGLACAQEAALKFKEVCGLHAEAFSAAEVRHGPWTLLGPDFPLLVFRQDDESAGSIDALVAEVVARGAPVFVAGAALPGATALPCPTVHPALAPIVQLQAFYRAAEALGRLRGYDPDQPPHLRKVTETL